MLVLEMLVMDLSPVHQLRLPGCVTDEVCDFGQVTPVSQASVSPAEDGRVGSGALPRLCSSELPI